LAAERKHTPLRVNDDNDDDDDDAKWYGSTLHDKVSITIHYNTIAQLIEDA